VCSGGEADRILRLTAHPHPVPRFIIRGYVLVFPKIGVGQRRKSFKTGDDDDDDGYIFPLPHMPSERDA
jgi:hypothetical protein